MSYDLHLLARPAGPDLPSAARARLAGGEEAIDPGPSSPEREAWKARLAAALRRANPRLAPFAFEYPALAARLGIAEDEARRRYRHIELNGPEGGSGVQITLADDTVDITIPYWHQRPAAATVFEEVWGYLGVLEREGDLATYDPQLDRILALAVDRPAVLESYGRVMTRTRPPTAPGAGRARPWWRFW
jgi:hypothetical protein